MRLRVGYVLTVVAMLSLGCSKNEQVNADLDAFDAFTTELVAKITSAATPVDGVTAARAYLDAQSEQIRTRIDRIGKVRGFQVNEDTKARITKSFTANVTKVMGLKIKMLTQTMRNKQLEAQLNKLIDDYVQLVKPD